MRHHLLLLQVSRALQVAQHAITNTQNIHKQVDEAIRFKKLVASSGVSRGLFEMIDPHNVMNSITNGVIPKHSQLDVTALSADHAVSQRVIAAIESITSSVTEVVTKSVQSNTPVNDAVGMFNQSVDTIERLMDKYIGILSKIDSMPETIGTTIVHALDAQCADDVFIRLTDIARRLTNSKESPDTVIPILTPMTGLSITPSGVHHLISSIDVKYLPSDGTLNHKGYNIPILVELLHKARKCLDVFETLCGTHTASMSIIPPDTPGDISPLTLNDIPSFEDNTAALGYSMLLTSTLDHVIKSCHELLTVTEVIVISTESTMLNWNFSDQDVPPPADDQLPGGEDTSIAGAGEETVTDDAEVITAALEAYGVWFDDDITDTTPVGDTDAVPAPDGSDDTSTPPVNDTTDDNGEMDPEIAALLSGLQSPF